MGGGQGAAAAALRGDGPLGSGPRAGVHRRAEGRRTVPRQGSGTLPPGGRKGRGAGAAGPRDHLMTPDQVVTGDTRSGFAAVIGAPNAGKSTLVNRLVGSKVSIVTQKVQTTRFPVRGVAMEGRSQIVLVDTPGIFKPRRRLDRSMVRAAWSGAEDADVVAHLICLL